MGQKRCVSKDVIEPNPTNPNVRGLKKELDFSSPKPDQVILSHVVTHRRGCGRLTTTTVERKVTKL
jgi:hypothetical protein